MNCGTATEQVIKGSIVICPKCGIHIAKVKKYVKPGESLDYSVFDWNTGPYCLNDQHICYKCFSENGHTVPWVEGGKIIQTRDLKIASEG